MADTFGFAKTKELFSTTKIFTTAKECFATAKLNSRNKVASGSPRRRLLLVTMKRFATAKVKARCGEEKYYGKATVGFTTVKVDRPEQQTSIIKPTIGLFSNAYIRVPTLRKNTLLRVSPLLFLNHFRVFDFL